MNTDTISPFRSGDASPLQEKYRTLQHEAYAYKRQRDKLANALHGVMNGDTSSGFAVTLGQALVITRDVLAEPKPTTKKNEH